jgi:hypothetical protein
VKSTVHVHLGPMSGIREAFETSVHFSMYANGLEKAEIVRRIEESSVTLHEGYSTRGVIRPAS